MANNVATMSKFLSWVLRHQPEAIGLTLDDHGWAEVTTLIDRANHAGYALTQELLEQVVATSPKQRFAFSADRCRIRANQGHSITIDLDLPPAVPPEILYHGTASRFIESIRTGGLQARTRQHVHLSMDRATATQVGQRHGQPVVLVVRAKEMVAAGHDFFCAANGVWLTEQVPIGFIDFPETNSEQ